MEYQEEEKMGTDQDRLLLEQSGEESPEPKKKNKKLITILSAVAAAVVIGVAAILLLAVPKASEDQRLLVFKDTDNQIHTLDSGDGVFKDTGIYTASSEYRVADRKLYYIDDSGTLMVNDLSRDSKSLADDVTDLTFVSEHYVVFQKDDYAIDQPADEEEIIDHIFISTAAYLVVYFEEFADADGYELYELIAENYDKNYQERTIENAKAYFEILTGKDYDEVNPDEVTTESKFYKYHLLNLDTMEEQTFTSAGMCQTEDAEGSSIYVFLSDDGTVNKLMPNGEIVSITTVEDPESVTLREATRDGRILFWTIGQGTNTEVYYHDSNGTNLLDLDMKLDTYSGMVYEDKDGSKAFLCTYDNPIICIEDGEAPQYVHTAKGMSAYSLATAQGDDFLSIESMDTLVNTYYTAMGENYQTDLYQFDEKLSSVKIKENIGSDLAIADGKGYAIMEKGLYEFSLQDPEKQEKIADNVYTFVLSPDNKHLYYLVDYDYEERTGTLYHYDTEKNTREKIDSGNIEAVTLTPFTDSTGLLYYKNNVALGETYQSLDEPYLYRNGQAPANIGRNVYTLNNLDSNVKYGCVDPNWFYFIKDVETIGENQDGTYNLKGALVIYDGKEYRELSRNIKY